MHTSLTRRSLLTQAAALGSLAATPAAWAADPVKLIYSDTITDQDLRAKALKEVFAPALGAGFDFKPYFSATLFKQGTEVAAMRRGNLDMAHLTAYDIQRQIPAWGVLTAAYLFRDIAHMQKVYASDVGQQLFKMAEDEAGIKILSVTYIGTRHLNLRGKKKIMKPQDLAGVKLRMPPGEGWQFVGTAMGANPTPMPFTEVYTGLQTGAIDAQDNPLPANKTMKFYEVTQQVVLTGHLIANNLLTVSKAKWDSLDAAQKAKLQSASNAFSSAASAQMMKEEDELIAFFKKEGQDIYAPDLKAFRTYALDAYQKSSYIKEWVPGMLDRINAL